MKIGVKICSSNPHLQSRT